MHSFTQSSRADQLVHTEYALLAVISWLFLCLCWTCSYSKLICARQPVQTNICSGRSFPHSTFSVAVCVWPFARVLLMRWTLRASVFLSSGDAEIHAAIEQVHQRTKVEDLFFPVPIFHTRSGAAMEVRRYRLTLKAGLLISSIRGGSKRTIKGGVFGSEEWGFINITTHGHGSENTSRRSLITRRCCAYTRTHAVWLAITIKKENNQLQHTHLCLMVQMQKVCTYTHPDTLLVMFWGTKENKSKSLPALIQFRPN